MGESVAGGRAGWMALWTLVCVELLAYQARYQVNDILGAEEDTLAPSAQSRGRLPAQKGAVAASRLVAGLRVAVAVYIILRVYDTGWHAESWRLGGVCLGVFVLAFGYENLRGLTRRAGPSAARHWGLLFLVTQGYPLRTLGGMLIMHGWQRQYSTVYLGTWVAATGLGLVFIIPTWILQAFDYVKRQSKEDPFPYLTESAHGKDHLMWLAGLHGWTLCDEACVEGESDEFKGSERPVLEEPPCRVPGWVIGNAIYLVGCWLALRSLGIALGWAPAAVYVAAAAFTLITPGKDRVVGIRISLGITLGGAFCLSVQRSSWLTLFLATGALGSVLCLIYRSLSYKDTRSVMKDKWDWLQPRLRKFLRPFTYFLTLEVGRKGGIGGGAS